jgi:thiol-disulfide isomerase/thioredoxin
MRRSLLATLAAALLLAAPLPARAQGGLAVGTTAPAAAVQTLDGKATDLSRYVGRGPVLIEFWATWCSNCKELEPQLRRIATRYAGRVTLLGVAVSANQSAARVQAYAAKHKLPLQVLYDHAGEATDRYDVPATSYVVVLDRAGKVVYAGQGGDQDLEAAVRRAL